MSSLHWNQFRHNRYVIAPEDLFYSLACRLISIQRQGDVICSISFGLEWDRPSASGARWTDRKGRFRNASRRHRGEMPVGFLPAAALWIRPVSSLCSDQFLVRYYQFKCWTLNGKWSYPCNRPWRSVGFSDGKDPTLSEESAVSLSAVRTGRVLLPINVFLPLVLISVTGWIKPRD
jgi:hypothetical protein